MVRVSTWAHLFEPFIRLHDSADYPGTGIGLAVVKNVIERHQGRIWVQSAPDQRTKFSFTLAQPKVAPAVEDSKPPATA